MRTSAETIPESRSDLPAPVVRPQTFRNNFLADVRIDHGPRDLYSRLFLRGDTLLRERGINLSFAPIDGLLQVNRENRDSWRVLYPVFNPEFGGMTPENSFVLLGRNASGKVIAAQGARVYDLGSKSFKEVTEELRLFYSDPERQQQPGESITITAPTAYRLYNKVIFSGAVWYHPEYRRQGLTSILPRLSKAVALTRWDTDMLLSFMAEDVVAGGTAPRAGYRHIEWEVIQRKSLLGDLRLALIYSSRDELHDYFQGLLNRPDAKVDAVVHERAAQQ